MRHNSNLDEINMGFAAAIVSAGIMLIMSLGARIGFYPRASVMMQDMHMFYSPSFLGTIGGMIEAAIISFVLVYLVIKIYNVLQNRN